MQQVKNTSEIWQSDIHHEYDCCLAAVQKVFRHLSLDDIRYPPHAYFDAALARQIAFYILVRERKWAQRRVSVDLSRGREALQRGLRTIRARMEASEEFACAYRLISQIAITQIQEHA